MKIRTGFVSNSSSSSFAIIGIEDDVEVNEIIISLGLTVDRDDSDNDWFFSSGGYGTATYQDLLFAGGSDGPYYVGLDADKVLQTMTIPEACKEFMKRMKERGIEVKSHVGFYYGEASSE